MTRVKNMQERKRIPQGKSRLNKCLEKKSYLVKKGILFREGVGTIWRHEAETHKSENKLQFILGSLSCSCAQAAGEKITIWSHALIKHCSTGKAVVSGSSVWELGSSAVGWESTKLAVLTGGAGATGRVRLHSHQNMLVLSVIVLFPTHWTCGYHGCSYVR